MYSFILIILVVHLMSGRTTLPNWASLVVASYVFFSNLLTTLLRMRTVSNCEALESIRVTLLATTSLIKSISRSNLF